jgi:proline racemase
MAMRDEEVRVKSKFKASWLWVVVGSALLGQASAHHSFAVFFDNEQGVVSVKGEVTEFRFKNPHGIIRVNVKGKDGAVEEWKAETNSPSILERRGWTRDSLKVGDEVVMEGWQARDGSHYMRMRKVTRPDGTPVGQPIATLEVR